MKKVITVMFAMLIMFAFTGCDKTTSTTTVEPEVVSLTLERSEEVYSKRDEMYSDFGRPETFLYDDSRCEVNVIDPIEGIIRVKTVLWDETKDMYHFCIEDYDIDTDHWETVVDVHCLDMTYIDAVWDSY